MSGFGELRASCKEEAVCKGRWSSPLFGFGARVVGFRLQVQVLLSFASDLEGGLTVLHALRIQREGSCKIL